MLLFVNTENRAGERQGKELTTVQAVQKEFRGFDKRKWTVFLVHGWMGSEKGAEMIMLREGFNKYLDFNVITVDWSDMARNIIYLEASSRTEDAGRGIAELIEFMVSNMGLSYNKVHIIGHSLGAHTAGYAGKFTKGRVARITGLDPAGPNFYTNGPESRLDSTDAQFVDVIHTAVGSLGHYKDIGHVDFYPNGGILQPGCGGTITMKRK